MPLAYKKKRTFSKYLEQLLPGSKDEARPLVGINEGEGLFSKLSAQF